ncbi:hypothetical protein Sjap_015158 [Stephania japonica]|uniref:Uncharacterized protein n=1 Tax=Stephania japonica TaxID=461633 RepID=A0AAP0IIK9_9MAGN
MESMSSSIPFTGKLKRYLRRREYQRLDGPHEYQPSTNRSTKVRITRFRGHSMSTAKSSHRRVWKIKAIPKLRYLKIVSPIKLLKRLRDAYVNMMLGITGNAGDSYFGSKRIPKARKVETVLRADEFETKLMVEIYKSLVASRRLANHEALNCMFYNNSVCGIVFNNIFFV